MPVDDRWLGVDEIAEYLGISRDTVYTWLNEKGMPGHRIGRLWKFKRDEVDGWVRAGGNAARRPRKKPARRGATAPGSRASRAKKGG